MKIIVIPLSRGSHLVDLIVEHDLTDLTGPLLHSGHYIDIGQAVVLAAIKAPLAVYDPLTTIFKIKFAP